MYTPTVQSPSGYNYSLNRNNQTSEQGGGVSFGGKSRAGRQPLMYTGGNSMGDIAAKVRSAMEGVTPDANGRVTFKQMQEHKKALEEEFTAQVKNDLLKLGVDPDIEFRLVMDQGTGQPAVISDHPQKSVVEKYLKSNPKIVEKFERIEMLGNLDRARSFQNTPISDVKRSIQASAVEAFFGDAVDNGMSLFSQMMDFSANGYSSGMAGLNLRV